MSKKISVVGAGVIGLSTALFLKSTHPELDITIYARDLPPNTTGDGAAGLWMPYLYNNTPKKDILRWSKRTWTYLTDIMKNDPHHPKHGIFYQYFYQLHEEDIDWDFFTALCPSARPMTADEMGMFPTFQAKEGIAMMTLMDEGQKIVNYLMQQFLNRGGKIVQRTIYCLDELAADGFTVVVNCTGLGSRTLCDDASMMPVRGHIIKVRAPWIRTTVIAGKYYVIPGSESVVLGGTKQINNWDTSVNVKDTQEILAGCEKLFPSLKHATIVSQWVGLRPGRDRIRIEKEGRRCPSTGRKYSVIHNYGHGGSGLTTFWGCAEEAGQLVLDEFLLPARL